MLRILGFSQSRELAAMEVVQSNIQENSLHDQQQTGGVSTRPRSTLPKCILYELGEIYLKKLLAEDNLSSLPDRLSTAIRQRFKRRSGRLPIEESPVPVTESTIPLDDTDMDETSALSLKQEPEDGHMNNTSDLCEPDQTFSKAGSEDRPSFGTPGLRSCPTAVKLTDLDSLGNILQYYSDTLEKESSEDRDNNMYTPLSILPVSERWMSSPSSASSSHSGSSGSKRSPSSKIPKIPNRPSTGSKRRNRSTTPSKTASPMSPYKSPPPEEKQRRADVVGRRPFVCLSAGCLMSYTRYPDMVRHVRTHYEVEPFKCTQCTKKFTRRDTMLRHIRRRHENNEDEGEEQSS